MVWVCLRKDNFVCTLTEMWSKTQAKICSINNISHMLQVHSTVQCLLFLFSNKYYHQRPHSHFIVYGRDFGKSHCLQVLKFFYRDSLLHHRSCFMNCKNVSRIWTESWVRRLPQCWWWAGWDVPYWPCWLPVYSLARWLDWSVQRCYRQSPLPPVGLHTQPR